MTGRELIIQVLEDGLENHEVVISIQEAALKCGVGVETMKNLVARGDIIKTELYWIPAEMRTK